MEGLVAPRYFSTREEWRQWLQENFEKEKGIWFICPLKHSGKKAILYNDAVEEALCFGWIDSTVKSFDKDHKIQRYSRRNPKSTYSQSNKERLKWLVKEGLIHESVRDAVSKVLAEEFVYPEDIIEALRKDDVVWENYQQFTDSYKRIRVAYIDSARESSEEFGKRLNNFIDKTRDGKLIVGYGGINKYY